MLANEQKEGTNGRYGPSVVVMRKKSGTKSQRSGGVSMVQGSGQPQQLQKRSELVLRTNLAARQTNFRSETAREAKRKLNGLAIDNVIRCIVNEPNWLAQDRFESSSKLKELGHANIRFDVDLSEPNLSHKSSVKGKKVLTRLRASQAKIGSAAGEANIDIPHLSIISQEQNFHDANAGCSNYGGQQMGSNPQFQFTTGQQSKIGHLRSRDFEDGAHRS